MRVVAIQFTPWEKIYHFSPSHFDLKEEDLVVVKTQLGLEVGKVVGLKELSPEEAASFKLELKPVLRIANSDDLKKIAEKSAQRKEALEFCKKLIEKYNLEMKLVDVHFSFDGGRITFAFIAEGRVDFRELVKDLTRRFQKSIRLQQLGIRDEAKMAGDIGVCGQQLCCKTFLKSLSSITSEYVETQELAHRGSERLSGICGRFLCCLAYEQAGYKELAEKLPLVGSKFKTEYGEGEVVARHILKQSVEVKIDKETVVEVPLGKQ